MGEISWNGEQVLICDFVCEMDLYLIFIVGLVIIVWSAATLVRVIARIRNHLTKLIKIKRFQHIKVAQDPAIKILTKHITSFFSILRLEFERIYLFVKFGIYSINTIKWRLWFLIFWEFGKFGEIKDEYFGFAVSNEESIVQVKNYLIDEI